MTLKILFAFLFSSIFLLSFSQELIKEEDLENAAFNLIPVSGKFKATPRGVRNLVLYFDPFKETISLIERKTDMSLYLSGTEAIKFKYIHSNHEDAKVMADTLFLCSKKPGSSIKHCGLFLFKEKFQYLDERIEDPTKKIVDNALIDLDKGELEKAIVALEKIPDLNQYGGSRQIAAQVLLKSHELSLRAQKEKKTKIAATILDRGFHFMTNQSRGSGSKKTIDQIALDHERYLSKDQFNRIVRDLGMLHLLSHDYKKSIQINLLLCTKLNPEAPGPFLSVGDGYYALGDKVRAKSYYARYQTIMKKAGAQSKIPSRVINLLSK